MLQKTAQRIRNFTDLEVWQLSKQLVIKVYQLLATFPKEETYGIVAQGKDAVVSVPSNIAEGFGRFYYKDRTKFYYNSRGSLEETKNHLLLSEAVGFITPSNRNLFVEILKEIDTLGRKLNNFITSNKIQAT